MLGKHLCHVPWVYSGVEHDGRSSHGSRGEILYLIHPNSLERGVGCKRLHILLGAARM